jgi:AraC-like DNA-binding protein
MDIWNMIELAGIGFGFAILILLVRTNRGARRYLPLMLFVFILIFDLFSDFIIDTHLIQKVPHLLYISEPFQMLCGLLIFLYVRNIEKQRFYLQKSDWFFLIPFGISLLNYMPYYFEKASVKLVDLKLFGGLKIDVLENIWEWNLLVMVNVGFLWAALVELGKYNRKIKEQCSDVQQLDLHLTQRLIKTIMLVYLLMMLVVYFTYFGFPYYDQLFTALELLSIALLFFIGYDAIVSGRHIQKIQKEWAKFPVSEVSIDGHVVKYAKTGLDEDSSKLLKEKLEQFMEEKKPYLQPQIKIKDLADMMGQASHQISQVINESFGQNFYEFVNMYRVNEAKILLKNPEFKNYTLTAIGFEVGFNSKSAFYNAFKKHTGTTPAKYV